MTFWEKGKPPDLGALWLAPSVEKDAVVLGIDCDRFFLKNKKQHGSYGRIMSRCQSSFGGIGALYDQI